MTRGISGQCSVVLGIIPACPSANEQMLPDPVITCGTAIAARLPGRSLQRMRKARSGKPGRPQALHGKEKLVIASAVVARNGINRAPTPFCQRCPCHKDVVAGHILENGIHQSTAR